VINRSRKWEFGSFAAAGVMIRRERVALEKLVREQIHQEGVSGQKIDTQTALRQQPGCICTEKCGDRMSLGD
jgi:hypothetical protein